MTRLRMGDTVVVRTGADRGKTGRILSLDKKAGKATVEGVNFKWKHIRPSQENPRGGRVQREYPVDLSNLAYWDAESSRGVRLGSAVQDGRKVRVARPTGKVVGG